MRAVSNTFMRLATLAMHRLSFHNDGGTPPAGRPASDAAAAGAAAAAASAAATPTHGGEGGATENENKEGAATPPIGSAAPEKYDLKLPDGSTLGADFVNRTADTARALGLTNEAGQKLLDAQIAEIAKTNADAVDAAKVEWTKAMQPGGAIWTEQEAKWRTTSLADAEIGGSPEKLEASVDLAKRVVTRFASDDAKKFFEDSGLGSHPELVRMFARIGKSMSEATLALPGARASAAMTEDERLAKRYPTMAAKAS
jgi:hypothetical protein